MLSRQLAGSVRVHAGLGGLDTDEGSCCALARRESGMSQRRKARRIHILSTDTNACKRSAML